MDHDFSNLPLYTNVCVYLDMLRFVNVQVGGEEAESNEAVGSIRKDVSCSGGYLGDCTGGTIGPSLRGILGV